MIEDSTAESIGEAVLNDVRKGLLEGDSTLLELRLDLITAVYRTRPDARDGLLYNDKICVMNKYIPNPTRPSELYFYNTALTTVWPRPEQSENKKTTNTKNPPCIIFMRGDQIEVFLELLKACTKMNQPVQSLYLHSATVPLPQPVSLSEQAALAPSVNQLKHLQVVKVQKTDLSSELHVSRIVALFACPMRVLDWGHMYQFEKMSLHAAELYEKDCIERKKMIELDDFSAQLKAICDKFNGESMDSKRSKWPLFICRIVENREYILGKVGRL